MSQIHAIRFAFAHNRKTNLLALQLISGRQIELGNAIRIEQPI